MSLTKFQSSVTWEHESVRCVADIRGKKIMIDEPEQLGGTDRGPNPVELVLAALGGCLNILATSFSAQHDVMLKDVRIEVEGDLDPDGFMGKNKSVRPGFQKIRYRIIVDSPSPQENVAELLAHIESICPVKDTLSGVPVIRS